MLYDTELAGGRETPRKNTRFHFQSILTFLFQSMLFFLLSQESLFWKKGLMRTGQILFSLPMRNPQATEARVTQSPGGREPGPAPAGAAPGSPALLPAAFASLSPSPLLPNLSPASLSDLQTLTISHQWDSFVLMSPRKPRDRCAPRTPQGEACIGLGAGGSLLWRIQGAGSCDWPLPFACAHFNHFF